MIKCYRPFFTKLYAGFRHMPILWNPSLPPTLVAACTVLTTVCLSVCPFIGADPTTVRGSGPHKNVVVGMWGFLWLGPPRKFHWNKFNVSKIDTRNVFVRLWNVVNPQVAWASPRTPLRELTALPRPSIWWRGEHPFPGTILACIVTQSVYY